MEQENRKQIDIAKSFGISQQTVSKIVNKKAWKNITP